MWIEPLQVLFTSQGRRLAASLTVLQRLTLYYCNYNTLWVNGHVVYICATACHGYSFQIQLGRTLDGHAKSSTSGSPAYVSKIHCCMYQFNRRTGQLTRSSCHTLPVSFITDLERTSGKWRPHRIYLYKIIAMTVECSSAWLVAFLAKPMQQSL